MRTTETRSHRRLWRDATTAAEIGELTAQWLTGDHRGYAVGCSR